MPVDVRATAPRTKSFASAARAQIVAALGAALLPAPAMAKTLAVGPGQTYAKPCQAIAAAAAGDIVEISAAGSYAGDTCAWSTDNLTVRGVNGRPKLDITNVAPAQKKGLFTIAAQSATIENLEFSGAAISVADGNNGAGIRHQGLNLTVRDCYFHDNQNGILGSPSAAGQGTVIIERSEFAKNGAGDGYSHNMYLGNYAVFTLRASYSHDAKVGHLVKVRAMTSNIVYNRLTDESGTASYEINLPNAGTAYVIGNVVEQSATTQNPTLVAYGEEGVPAGWDTRLYVINNTFLNRKKTGTFVSNRTTTPAVLTNNIFWNGGTIASAAGDILTANFDSSTGGDPLFANVAQYDVHLQAASPCVDKGEQLINKALQPISEYTHPLGLSPRVQGGAKIDIGAYEYGVASRDMISMGSDDFGSGGQDGAGADGGTGTDPDPGTNGCACNVGQRDRSGHRADHLPALALLLAVSYLGRRRRRTPR